MAYDEHVLYTGRSPGATGKVATQTEGAESSATECYRLDLLGAGSVAGLFLWGQGSQEPCPLWKGRVIPCLGKRLKAQLLCPLCNF